MKKLILVVILFLAACAPATPDPGQVQTAIAQTQAAQPVTPTPEATIDPFELTKQANQTQNAAYQATVDANSTNIALTPTATITWTPRPSATHLPTSTPTIAAGSRNNPFKIGRSIGFVQNKTIEYDLTVTEVIRGDEAWSIIYSANRFNDAPPDGMEYVLVRVHVKYTGPDKGALELNEYDWSSVTNGRMYDAFDVSVCCLEPEFDIVLFANGEAEGLIPLLVAIDDTNPLAAFSLKSDGTGGFFFSLTP